MQDFTLHTHNNEFGWDGRYSAKEMLQAAQDRGFKTIGVSNHLTYHDNVNSTKIFNPMFRETVSDAIDICKKHIEVIENLKSQFKIDIKIGFEVDVYNDKNWQINFEKIIKAIDVDYLIGATHFLPTKDCSNLYNIFDISKLATPLDSDEINELVVNHFKTIKFAIESGYFSFIAHMDYCSLFNYGTDKKFDVYKYEIMEALIKHKQPFEINTSGYRKSGRPYPDYWMIEHMAKDNTVPVIISDDSHFIEHIGANFDTVEKLLQDLNYTNRFTLDMLKKPH